MKRILFSLILALSLALPAAAQVVEDPSTGASISSGSTISGCNAITAILNVVTGALTCNPASVVNGTVSTAGRSILTIKDTISGSSATSNFLNVTGSFPATLSAETTGVLLSGTFDNDAQTQSLLKVLGAGTADANAAVVRINNGASIARPLVIEDNGTAVFTIADGGLATFTNGVTMNIGLTMGGNSSISIGGTGQLLANAGSVGSPAATFGTAGTGIYARTGSVVSFATGSTGVFEVNASDFFGVSAGRIGFTNGALNGTLDTFFRRGGAAATMQMGSDVNGAPTDQTIQAHNGITGTDIKGAALNLRPGLGTGAAVSNPLTLQRVVTKATGTTAQTYSPAIVACPTKILSNTSATAQTIATITTTSTTGGSVTVDYSVVANNGTLQDTDGGMVKVAWNNNAGTVAATMSAVFGQVDSDASGTLAATPTATVATNVVSIKFTPTWVTIVPTTVTGWATFTLHTSGDTVVCQ